MGRPYVKDSVSYLFFRASGDTAGLLNSAFTKNLFLNGSSSALTVTITELSGGLYYASFTPNVDNGIFQLEVYETSKHRLKYYELYYDQALIAGEGGGDITGDPLSASINDQALSVGLNNQVLSVVLPDSSLAVSLRGSSISVELPEQDLIVETN